MKINHRHYVLILCALASLAAAVFGYVFVYYEIARQNERYAEADYEVNSEDGKKHYEQGLLKTYESSKDNLSKLSSFIVREDKIVDFIEMVEKIGEDSHTDLELSAIGSEKDRIRAKINAKGSWTNVMQALILIENIPVSSYISNVSLAAVSSLESSGAESDKKSSGVSWNLWLDIEAITIK